MIHARYIKIEPRAWQNYMSMRCDVYVSGKLNNTPESDRYYSSVYSNDAKGTGHARSMINSDQAWSSANGSGSVGMTPTSTSYSEYVILDLGSIKKIHLLEKSALLEKQSCENLSL